MGVRLIKATIECDGCGCEFHVELDEARRVPEGWSLYDLVEDTIRGEMFMSVQAFNMLCRRCTSVVDEFVTEDRDATHEEVSDALHAAS